MLCVGWCEIGNDRGDSSRRWVGCDPLIRLVHRAAIRIQIIIELTLNLWRVIWVMFEEKKNCSISIGWSEGRKHLSMLEHRQSRWWIITGYQRLIAFFVFRFVSEFIVCKHCGTDLTLSNFFVNSYISPLALTASNQTFYNRALVLEQLFENPVGIKFKVVVLQRANCVRSDSRVSFPIEMIDPPSNANLISRTLVVRWFQLVSRIFVESLLLPQMR